MLIHAAILMPAAAIADAMTNSGMSKLATITGSSLPSVLVRTCGETATAPHQSAPATAWIAKYARPQSMPER